MTFKPNEFFNKEKALEHYLQGYRKAKQFETEDFSVLLGVELRFYATVNDYLIYGVTEEMLYELPFLLPLYIKKASRLFRERGCIFIQAHPFRQFITRAKPKYLDGVEVFNGKAAKASYNVKLGDMISVAFGTKTVTVRVLEIKETTKKSESASMYEVVSESDE